MLQQDSHLQQQLDTQVVISCLKFEQKKISLYLSTSTDNFNSFKSTDTLADEMLTRGLPPLLMIATLLRKKSQSRGLKTTNQITGHIIAETKLAEGKQSRMKIYFPIYSKA